MTTNKYVEAIRASELTIYDKLPPRSPLFIPTKQLEMILNKGMRGFPVAGMALRTRSKAVKIRVCEVLGYPVPKSFRKDQPRFPGQKLDAYTQTSNNLQVWNQALAPTRRYAIMREAGGILIQVRVVTGQSLALFDRTGTLTQKYQARLNHGSEIAELVSLFDTEPLRKLTSTAKPQGLPTDDPRSGELLSISAIFAKLQTLIGRSFPDAGKDQERNRGAALHRLTCEALGYSQYADDGQFPDIKNQLLEVKLQTSSTIDLGLISPDSNEALDTPPMGETQMRSCDCRYAIFAARTDGEMVTLERVYVTTGESFFARFPRFGGKIVNRKIQIPLPADFF